MAPLNIALTIASLLSLTAAFPSNHLLSRQVPQDPSMDPFYQPPAGFETQAPGAILRQRSIVPAFSGVIPDPIEAYQLLFRTTAINGSAIAGVTTVFKPLIPKTDRFISFHTAYDASSVSCDPSYQYQLGVVQSQQYAGITTELEFLMIQIYLAQGYVVSAPDYEGPDAAFTPGRLEGMVTLDSMRAVAHFGETVGLTTENPMIFGDGYSGGAIASGWGASLQSTYAPELNIKGWAQGGTPANLTGTLLYIDDSPNSGFLTVAVDGLLKPSAYGAQLQPLFNEIVTPAGILALEQANAECTTAALDNFKFESILSTGFQTAGPDVLYNPILHPILEQNIMGLNASERPIVPVFVYHASLDEIIPYDNVTTLVNSWCEQGATVQFTTFAAGGHATTDVLGIPEVANFADAAFSGTLPTGCSRSTVLDNALDRLALGVDIEPLLNALSVALNNFNSTS